MSGRPRTPARGRPLPSWCRPRYKPEAAGPGRLRRAAGVDSQRLQPELRRTADPGSGDRRSLRAPEPLCRRTRSVRGSVREPAASKEKLEAAIEGHVLAAGELMGT